VEGKNIKDKKKIKKEINYFIHDGSSIVNFVGSLNTLENNILSANELSLGLSHVMLDGNLATAYNRALDLQGDVMGRVTLLSKELQPKFEPMSALMGSVVAPLSGAIAEIGLVSANTHKLFELGTISKELAFETDKIATGLLAGINGQQSIFSASLHEIDKYGALNLSGITDTARMVSSGVVSMLGSLPSYSTELTVPSIDFIQERTRITKEDISKQQEKLDAMLRKINVDLVEYRLGCWHTLQQKGPDYLGQASSSMRRLIDNLLRELAPDKDVIKTSYFINSKTGGVGKDKNGNPTRKARILFIVNFEDTHAEHLERLAEGIIKTYDSLSAWDHVPLKKELFMEGAFTQFEGHLISLLSETKYSL
jgi:hypothetical protein